MQRGRGEGRVNDTPTDRPRTGRGVPVLLLQGGVSGARWQLKWACRITAAEDTRGRRRLRVVPGGDLSYVYEGGAAAQLSDLTVELRQLRRQHRDLSREGCDEG